MDAQGHQQITFTDGLGRKTYDQRFTGTTPATYATYTTTKYSYDYNGNLVQILQPDGVSTTTFTYDDAGRKIGVTDPDLGNQSSVFDPNGNLIQASDARGSAGTVYAGYDGLNRQVWRNTTNSQTGAYVTYSYDTGSYGAGRQVWRDLLRRRHDRLVYLHLRRSRARDRRPPNTSPASPTPNSKTYNDAGNVTSQLYPNGDTLSTRYTHHG